MYFRERMRSSSPRTLRLDSQSLCRVRYIRWQSLGDQNGSLIIGKYDFMLARRVRHNSQPFHMGSSVSATSTINQTTRRLTHSAILIGGRVTHRRVYLSAEISSSRRVGQRGCDIYAFACCVKPRIGSSRKIHRCQQGC